MAPAAKAPAGKGGGSFFTNKVGPLPMWGWIAVAVVGIIIYRKVSGGGSSSSTSGTTSASDQAALLNAQAAADYASLTTAGGSYSGPVGGAPTSITDPTTSTTSTGATGGTVTAGTPPETTTPGPTASAPTPGATPASYLALTSPAAIQGDINAGQTLYQSGTEAQAWDLANGTPAGQSLPDPNQYYALSGPAAVALGASGKPVYVKQGG